MDNASRPIETPSSVVISVRQPDESKDKRRQYVVVECGDKKTTTEDIDHAATQQDVKEYIKSTNVSNMFDFKQLKKLPVVEKDGYVQLGPTFADAMSENSLNEFKKSFDASQYMADYSVLNTAYNAEDLGAVRIVSEHIYGKSVVSWLKSHLTETENDTAAKKPTPVFELLNMIILDSTLTSAQERIDFTRAIKSKLYKTDHFVPRFLPMTDIHDLGTCAARVSATLKGFDRFQNAYIYPQSAHNLGIFGNSRDETYCTSETPFWTSQCDDKQQFAFTPVRNLISALFDQISNSLKNETQESSMFMLFTFLSHIGLFGASDADDPTQSWTEYERKRKEDGDEDKQKEGVSSKNDLKLPNNTFIVDFYDETFIEELIKKYVTPRLSTLSNVSKINEADVLKTISKKIKLTVYLLNLYELRTSKRLVEECIETLDEHVALYDEHVQEESKAKDNEGDLVSTSTRSLPSTKVVQSEFLNKIDVTHVSTVVEAVEDAIVLCIMFGFRREIEKAYAKYKTTIERTLFESCDWLSRMGITEENVNDVGATLVSRFRSSSENANMLTFFQRVCFFQLRLKKEAAFPESDDYLYKTYAFFLKSLYDVYASLDSDNAIRSFVTDYENQKPFESDEVEYEFATKAHERIVRLIYSRIDHVSDKMKRDLKENSSQFYKFINMWCNIATARAEYERTYVEELSDVASMIVSFSQKFESSNVFERCRAASDYLKLFFKSFYEPIISQQNADIKKLKNGDDDSDGKEKDDADGKEKDDPKDRDIRTRMCKTKNFYPNLLFPPLCDSKKFFHDLFAKEIFENEHLGGLWIKNAPTKNAENRAFDEAFFKGEHEKSLFDEDLSTLSVDNAYTFVNHAPWLPFIDATADKMISETPSAYKRIKKNAKKHRQNNRADIVGIHPVDLFQSNVPYAIALKDGRLDGVFSSHDDHAFYITMYRIIADELLKHPDDLKHNNDSLNDVRVKVFNIFSSLVGSSKKLLPSEMQSEQQFIASFKKNIKKYVSELCSNLEPTVKDVDVSVPPDSSKIEAIASKAVEDISETIAKRQKGRSAMLFKFGFELFRAHVCLRLFYEHRNERLKRAWAPFVRDPERKITADAFSEVKKWIEEFDVNAANAISLIVKRQVKPYEEQIETIREDISVKHFTRNVRSYDDWSQQGFKIPYLGCFFDDPFLKNESWLNIFLSDMLDIVSVSPLDVETAADESDDRIVRIDRPLNKMQLFFISNIKKNGSLLPFNKIKTHLREFLEHFDAYLASSQSSSEPTMSSNDAITMSTNTI